jgi:diaminopimelate epimerase
VVQTGREFYKMSGSGNDFVFVDTRAELARELEDPAVISAICARGTGVGADGIVFLGDTNDSTLGIRYLNSDGSLAALCGNATLCAARLAVEFGMAPRDREFTIATDSGVITARVREGLPEIDLQPVTELHGCFEAPLTDGEQRIGFALVGVPHLVVLCADVDGAPVIERGRQLRFDGRLSQGANVNFVSRSGGRWKVRTYERGVENETLACGTGAVATALLLSAWGAASADRVSLETRSERTLGVRQRAEAGAIFPSLSGEARIVFTGRFAELPKSRE